MGSEMCIRDSKKGGSLFNSVEPLNGFPAYAGSERKVRCEMDGLFVFINQLINGLQVGSIYALVALGYTMVYGIVKLINFAHGDFIMVGAYLALFSVPMLLGAGLPAILVIVLVIVMSVIGCSLLGMATERIAYKPLRGSPSLSVLITAIAVSLFLENLFMILFSSASKPFPAIISANPISICLLYTSDAADE